MRGVGPALRMCAGDEHRVGAADELTDSGIECGAARTSTACGARAKVAQVAQLDSGGVNQAR
jgi:hypothetical protein